MGHTKLSTIFMCGRKKNGSLSVCPSEFQEAKNAFHPMETEPCRCAYVKDLELGGFQVHSV